MTTSCPEPDILIDVTRDPTSVPADTRRHVETCLECQSDLSLLESVRHALDTHAGLPDEWVEEILMRLPGADAPAQVRTWSTRAAACLVTGTLATLTIAVVATVLAPPSWYAPTPWERVAALALLVGGLAATADARWMSNDPTVL